MHNRYRLACSATVAAAAVTLLVAAPAAADPSTAQSTTSSASSTDSSTGWRDQFSSFVKSLPGSVHMSITPAGVGATESAGTSDAGSTPPPAWGTIRVPLGLAAIRDSHSDSSTAAEVSTSIGSSDATSSNALIRSLGSDAARSVQAAMADLGDRHTRVQSAADYAALARTPWQVDDQSLFGARLLCSQDRSPVTTPMLTRSDTTSAAADSTAGAAASPTSAAAAAATSTSADGGAATHSAATATNVGSSTQTQWGLQHLSGSSVQHVAAHGGWGPATDGRYLARQMALVQTVHGLSSIAVSASATEPGRSEATGLVDKVADWLQKHLPDIPAGFCDASDAKAVAGAASTAATADVDAGATTESTTSSAAADADGQAAAGSPTTAPEAGAAGAEATSPTTPSSTTSPSAPQPSPPAAAPSPVPAPASSAPQLVAPQQVCQPTVVALDPGHSPTHVEPFDPVTGAKMVDDPNGAEGDDNLYVANAVKRALERSRGYKVVLLKTRVDEQVTYRERIARAEQAGAAIGVSIHTSPGDNAIFPQRDGLFREGPGADGATKRVTFTDPQLATRSQLYSTKLSAARQAAEGHTITIRDNSFNGRAPLWSGNIPIISLISQKVPWVYNEFGPDSGGGGADAISHNELDRYATGIADGVRAATPPARCDAPLPQAAAAPTAVTSTAAPVAGRTGCRRVVQIGDSTSVAVDDPGTITDPGQRLTSQLNRVGVSKVTLNASSGRSIVEHVDNNPNAIEGVQSTKGDADCWIIAMGVNDANNIAGGSRVGYDERINQIMHAVDGQPVLWPTIGIGNSSSPTYTTDTVDKFNAALRAAAERFPNLSVYDWRSAAKPEWYAGDGIHYTAVGYAQRNIRFADALAIAYPTGQAAAAVKIVPA